MDSPRKDSLPDDSLTEICSRFNVETSELVKLEAFENFVFAYESEKGPRILRVTHRSHRQPEQIAAEFEWVEFLRRNGFQVATALESPGGQRLVQTGDQEFTAVVLPRVQGNSIHGPEHASRWTPELFQLWGQTVGRLHAVTRAFAPGRVARHSWHEDRYLTGWEDSVGPGYPELVKPWRALLQRLHGLPRNRDNFGLVHCDLHSKNFYVDGSTLHVFDTDDSHYDWFMYDVASIFLSVVHNPLALDSPLDFLGSFAPHFWRGYRQEHSLSQNEIRLLPLFLKLRQYLLLGAVLHKWDFDKLSGEKLKLVERFKDHAENDSPPLEMTADDWQSLLS